jgi:transcription elongation factor SPT6
MRQGETASVLAVSWGKGDPLKDAITLVILDEAGRFREHMKIDNLVDNETVAEFLDLVRRRKPDVVVVGGFTMATSKLCQSVKELLRGEGNNTGSGWGGGEANGQAFDIPVTFVYDEVARIYQHSKRAADEFSALSLTAKYCVGLARYAQSPLNEYAALGNDITAIAFDEDDQHLVRRTHVAQPIDAHLLQVPQEKLLLAFERVLVDITNKVGVDVNRAVTDSYFQHLLPFVCGLGPRKAQVVVKKISGVVSFCPSEP